MTEIENLTARQVQCLRLVAQGITTSKEIAARTRLEPSSIDNYLSRAASILGVDGRLAAAARFAALESSGESAGDKGSVSRSVYRSAGIAGRRKSVIHHVAAAIRWLLKVPPLGGRQHHLNRIEITFSILKIAAVSFTFFIVLVLMGAGLLWVLN